MPNPSPVDKQVVSSVPFGSDYKGRWQLSSPFVAGRDDVANDANAHQSSLTNV